MKLIRAVVVLSLLLACATSSQAQSPAIQQFQNNQLNLQQQQLPAPGLRAGTNAPELYPGENADVGPQRILRDNPRPKYFDVFLDTEIFYSDNANYASVPSDKIGSFIFVNTVQGAIVIPPITAGPGKFEPTIGVSSQWYNYENGAMSPFNFDALTAFAGTKYSTRYWAIYIGANFTRIANQSDGNETYHEALPQLSVTRYIPVNDYLLVAIGDQVDYHFTRVPPTTFGFGTNSFSTATDLNNRFDNILYVTVNIQATKHLAIQPYYRFQYSYYPTDSEGQGCRRDLLNAAGLMVIYTFTDYLSVKTYFNYNNKVSNDPAGGYDEMNGGVGASLDLKF